MADVSAALRDRLKALATVSAIVSDRVYLSVRPQKTPLPALVITKVSPGRTYTFKGRVGLEGSRFRFAAFADRRGVARALADAVIDEIERPAEFGGVRFDVGFLQFDRDLGEQNASSYTHHQNVEMIVWWSSI